MLHSQASKYFQSYVGARKYRTIRRLSNTTVAETQKTLETATKLTPPPMYDPVIIPAISTR